MTDTQILQQILSEIQDLKQGQTKLEAGQTKLEQEVSDMRHTQTAFEQNITQQFGAINDQFAIIRSIAEESMSMLKNTKALLEEDIEEKVATGAMIIELTKRVEVLERKAV